MSRPGVALAAALAVVATTAALTSAAPPPAAPPAAVAGDFDGDGRADLYLPGPGSAHETFLFGTADGRFATEVVPLDGTFVARAGDFDGDGADDLLLFSSTGPDAVWYGGADRGMSRVRMTATGSSTPVIGDYDGDGRADVYWSGPGRGTDRVWYGNATRRFTSRTVSGRSGHPVAGDFDGDTRTDLLWPAAGLTWFAGRDRGAFTAVEANVPADREPLVGDFDGNGAADVFWYGTGSLADYVDYGALTRLPHRVGVEARGPYVPTTGDFDGDGVTDVFLNGSGTDWVWYGTRLMTFDRVSARTVAAAAGVPADFDADGRDDLYWPDKTRIWYAAKDARAFVSAKPARVPNRVPAFDRAAFRPYGYVAHAMGAIDGHAYTNSREAFEANHAAGFRTYEVDLVRLGDGNVIAAHDRTEHWLGLDKKFKDARIEDVAGRKWLGKYDLLTAADLVDLLAEHRDVYFILDIKWDSAAVAREMYRLAADPQVARRMLPHVENQADLDGMRRHYPVQHYVLALYRTQSIGRFDDAEVLAFVRRNATPAVMMWINQRDPSLTLAQNSSQRRRYTPAFEQALRGEGATTFVHSTRDTDLMARFEARGVGVYSDGAFGPPDETPGVLPVG